MGNVFEESLFSKQPKQFEKVNVKSVYVELPNGKNAFMENGIIKESDGLSNMISK